MSAVMERHDPRLMKQDSKDEEARTTTTNTIEHFVSKNSFEALIEPVDLKSSPANAFVVPSQMSLEEAGSPAVPEVDPSWTRSLRTAFKPRCPDSCQCTARCEDDSIRAAPMDQPEEAKKEERAVTRPKKNQAARRSTRRLVAAGEVEKVLKHVEVAVLDYVDVEVSDYVTKTVNTTTPSWIRAGSFCFDLLVQNFAERKHMPMAKINYALFHGLDEAAIGDKVIKATSAGVFGWSEAKIEQLQSDPSGSTVRSPGSADDDRPGEMDITKNNKDPPEVVGGRVSPESSPQSKPHASAYACLSEIDERIRQVKQQLANDNMGKKNIGIYKASEIDQELDSQWREVVRDRREGARERKIAGLHVLVKDQSAAQP